jgi:hypothetical protein
MDSCLQNRVQFVFKKSKQTDSGFPNIFAGDKSAGEKNAQQATIGK